MITLWQLLQNTSNLLYVLIQMAIIWSWSMIKYFLPKKRKNVTGEILFITGAGNGIGRFMSIKFAELGATVICTSLSENSARETADIITSHGGKAYSYQLDVTDRTKVYSLADQISKEIGDVTMLVNNAGFVTGKKILDSPDALMVKTMEVNAISHFWTLKAFLPNMFKNNHGHIITIASIAGQMGGPAMIDYCASKFASVGIHEALTVELLENPNNNIKTSCVCPYFIKTGMFDGCMSGSPFTLPMMEVDYTVDAIINGILNDDEIIYVPKILMFLITLKRIAPCGFNKPLAKYMKLHEQMKGFVGRQKSKKQE